jgi:tetratricopeptide (TPR) repeat protein
MKIHRPGTRLGQFEVVSYPFHSDLTLDYTCLDLERSCPALLKALRPELLASQVSHDCFAQIGTDWVSLGSHPHIVCCINVFKPENSYETFLVLQVVVPERERNTSSLLSWLNPGQALPVLQALLFALQIVRGMLYVVNKMPGFVHGDLKPDCVLVSGGRLSQANVNRVRVTDFGLATVFKSNDANLPEFITTDKSAVGQTQIINGVVSTPLYMSPEQWRGESKNTTTDIYALGCLLYKMLVGRHPVAGDTTQALRNAHCTGNVRPYPVSLPSGVIELTTKCLALDPEKRFQNWEEVEKAIAAAYESTIKHPVPAAEPMDAPTESERKLEGWFLNSMGCASSDIGNLNTAAKCLELALKTGRNEGDQALLGTTTSNLGEVERRLGNTQRAIDYHKKALTISEEIGDRSVEGSTLNNLGMAYLQLGKPREAIEYIDQALTISRETSNKRGEMATLVNLGSVYHQLGDLRRSFQYHEQELAIARKLGDRRGESFALANLGALHSELGDDRRAIQCQEQSLDIKSEIGDLYSQIASLNNLANAYRNLGNAQQAFEYYNKALEIARGIGDRRGEAFALNNMGSTYSNLGNMEKALEYHERALEIFCEIGDKRSQGDCLTNMGFIYMIRHDMDRALEYCEQALTIDREVGDMLGLALDSFNMANLLVQQGNFSRALPYAEESASILDKAGDTGRASQVHQLVAMIRTRLNSQPSRPVGFVAVEHTDISQQILKVRQDNPELTAKMSDDDIIILLQQADLALEHGKPMTFIMQTPKAESMPGGLPSDFISRCAVGLKGSSVERQVLFDYLGEVFRKTSTPEAEKLVKNVQLTLLGKDPGRLDSDLPEPYAAIWQQILARLA